MRRAAILVAIALSVAGCQTPYKPSGLMGGYEELQLSSDTYHITGRGNGYTSEFSFTADSVVEGSRFDPSEGIQEVRRHK